ncbi:MAG TPA: phosphonatase-like hydrolase [Vicinamibacterales bacterium]
MFDLAGTTVKDSGQVARAFAAALAEIGVSVTAAQVADVRGASKREAIRQFIADGPDRDRRAAGAYSSFQIHLARLYRSEGVEAIAGATDVFRWLRDRHVRVGLNTGFDREITTLLLNTLDWNDSTVDAIVCGDDVTRGRPAPDLILRTMERTGVTDARLVLNVGDTVLDLQAGRNAGVRWNVGVLSGGHDRQRLEQAPHTHLIDSVADLKSLIPHR